jgi:cysteine-S-conjugate beta-lyase
MPGVPIDLHVPDLRALHERRSEKWSGLPADVLASTVAEMDFPLAEPVAAALEAAIRRGDTGYVPKRSPEVGDSLARFARRRMDWTIDPEQVTLVSDVMVGLVALCRELTRGGGAIAFATPAYPPFLVELELPGVSVFRLPLTAAGGHDLERLSAAIAEGVRVLVVASPHNPTGRVFSQAELAAVAELCAERGVWVLADEIHAPLTLPGAVHTPWLEVSAAAREYGIALTSASKAFNLAAFKTAFVVTASASARAVVERLPPTSDHVGLFGVIAAEAAFDSAEEWLDAVLAQLDVNRRVVGEQLAQLLPGVHFNPPQATYLAWLDCGELGLGDDPAEAFLRRGRVALSRGLDYGSQGAAHVRLNFGTSPSLVAEMVTRMRMSLR